ncbi:hypothetical protein MTO96_035356, partial [Rhipicephalus appendiculatus]
MLLKDTRRCFKYLIVVFSITFLSSLLISEQEYDRYRDTLRMALLRATVHRNLSWIN